MPPHPSYNFEKSPVDHWDYSGLQLDTRARENSEKHIDSSKLHGFAEEDFEPSNHYYNEKQNHARRAVAEAEWGPNSPDSTLAPSHASPSPISPSPFIPRKNINEAFGAAPPVPPERRICGMRKRSFWILFGVLLALVLAAAIIGGVVGGLQARKGKSESSLAPFDTSNSSTGSNFLNSSDVRAGSPLSVVTYDEGPGQSFAMRQAFRVVYQSTIGDIKEAVQYHLQPWLPAVPIFTDAMNGTGLASATYLNMTSQQGSVFYVGTNGLLQEKRKIFNNTDPWIPGSLVNSNIPMAGNFSNVPAKAPSTNWDGYQMAAVYSPHFQDGAGIRLFYHAVGSNGNTFVQELIWNQGSDAWKTGAQITKPFAYSHLAVSVDESTKILRLLFSSGSKTLSEQWLNISNVNAGYSAGQDIKGVLNADNADIGAVSLLGTTYVYHYAAASQGTDAGIHELTITGFPTSNETYVQSPALVVAPQLNTSAGQTSQYQPLFASYTAVPGLAQQIFVMYADQPSGDPTASVSSFHELAEVSRATVGNANWGTQMSMPLGDINVGPADPSNPGQSNTV